LEQTTTTLTKKQINAIVEISFSKSADLYINQKYPTFYSPDEADFMK